MQKMYEIEKVAPVVPTSEAQWLGSMAFRSCYGLKYAYVAGAMYRGTASTDLVVRLGQAGLLGYFGTGGLSLKAIESDHAGSIIRSAKGYAKRGQGQFQTFECA
ncbi:hypothetical protein [Mycoavidus sp. SF9855]|uniref:hypothetical protein n=1 Tax=Mycoavidus sp. SF9855 TaxID=2968475 RepID=UPI00211BD80F|nr:hypothetical protein [Mycoavidus sp. SF9855]UUM21843.1 hypothetical protein NQD60_01650 [Mycoavidus sp. SF9855]